MNRSLYLLTGLLVLALIAAYGVSNRQQRAGSSRSQEVEVWNTRAEKVHQLEYETKTLKLVLETQWTKDSDTPEVWVKESRFSPASKNTDSKPVETTYRGSEEAWRLIQQFASLKAERSLGALANLPKEGFGLPAPDSMIRLVMEGEDTPSTLEMGELNFSRTLRYVRDGATDRVFLLRQNKLLPFSRSRQTLFDAKVFTLAPREATRMSIRKGDKEKTLWNLQPENRGAGQWSDNPDRDPSDPAVTEFADVLNKLRITNYPEEADLAPDGETGLEISLFQKKESIPAGWLRVYSPTRGPPKVETSRSSRPVRVSPALATKLLEIAEKLFVEE